MTVRFTLFVCISILFFGSIQSQNNVLLIIADDLGVDYISAYGLGSDPAPTPIIDSLANNGLVFQNAWTSPICSPSRANILTGKYAHRTGIGTAITGPQNVSLDTSEYTIPKAITDQTGAKSALIGKYHLGHASQARKSNPNAIGFDRYAGNLEGQLGSYTIWTKTVDGINENVLNQYATTVAVDDAIDWIDDQTGDWLVTLSFNAPHEPFHKPPNNLHSFDGLSNNAIQIALNPQPYYKAMIESMDTEIGRLLDHLTSISELDNTDIIFIGDNGTPKEVVEAPFIVNRAKATIYNGGIQVPLIISGPTVAQTGQVRPELVNSTDLYKTILDLMGGNSDNLASNVAQDSKSLLSIINGTSDSENQREWIMAEIFKPTTNVKDGKSITNGSFKLLEFDNGISEFYNFSGDFFESNPLPINNLTTAQQVHYDMLCSTLGNLVNENYCDITGIFEQTGIEFSIYPNPTSELIRFDFSELAHYNQVEIQLFDTKGALLLDQTMDRNNNVINISHLNSGKYQVLISNKNETLGTGSFLKL